MIGREKERQTLERLYQRQKAEFVAIYGRRRVGKTFLVDETFGDRITFRHAGLSPVEWRNKEEALSAQLNHFYKSLKLHGLQDAECPTDWLEAFYLLEKLLLNMPGSERQVIFLDELPWMDTENSLFITALEGFWNTWACHRKNLMLVVCGSASSWMLDHLINNHGGLYGRLTCSIRLAPFTLRESEQFLQEKGVKLSRYDIVQAYMAVGGIPYYLDAFEEGLSLAQNLDQMFFADYAKFEDEYDRLFSSIFTDPDRMKTIISFLYSRNAGFTRKQIGEKLGMSSGGTLTNLLKALIGSDFVTRYYPYGLSKREVYYKLTDPFCLFYLHFLSGSGRRDHHFWLNSQNTPSVVSWRGYAFENVCFRHIDQIKQALGIGGVRSEHSAWSVREDDREGAQIDLLIKRDDHVLNACEIKFVGDEFAVDQGYYRKLQSRQQLLMETISPKWSIHQTLITTYGLHYNEYSGIFSRVIVINDLFREL